MLTRYPTKKHSDGLETASIGLTYPLSLRNGFRLAAAKSDKLQLKCTAKIGSIYWESVVVETILRRDGYMLESRSSGASGMFLSKSFFFGNEGWEIGGFSKFHRFT